MGYAMIHGLAMIALAGLFGAGDRFDLICSVPDYNGLRPTAIEVRVDLARRVYCIDACEAGAAITQVNDTAILLYDGDDGGRHKMRISLLRDAAGRTELHFYRGSHPDRRGVCETRPFSGVPDPRPGLLGAPG